MTAHLRPLVQGDAPAVLAAFRGDPTMTRQGRVEDLADARAYVERVTDAAAPSVFALLSDDVVVGVVGFGRSTRTTVSAGSGTGRTGSTGVAGSPRTPPRASRTGPWERVACTASSSATGPTTRPPAGSPARPVSCPRDGSGRSSSSTVGGSTC